MRDLLRTELAGLPTVDIDVSRLRIAREPVLWAFICGIGAGFLVGGVLTSFFALASPILFPLTEPRPSWLNGGAITRFASALAIGAVAMRIGGPLAIALDVIYELVQIVARLPGVQLACARDQPTARPCDLGALVLAHWPTWLALAIGAALFFSLSTTGDRHPNRLLRSAGALSFVITVAVTAYAVIFFIPRFDPLPSAADPFPQVVQIAATAIYVIGSLVAGLVAGVVSARAPLAAALLVALLSTVNLPFLVTLANQPGILPMPLFIAFLTYSGVIATVLGALGVAAGRVLAWRITPRA